MQHNIAGLELVGRLPAAAELDQREAGPLLHAALTERGSSTDGTRYSAVLLLPGLLQLPAVQRLTPDAVAWLMLVCVETRQHSELLLLHHRLPAAQHAEQDKAKVRQLLLSALETQQWQTFDWLMQLPTAALIDDPEAAMWRVVRACHLAQ